MYINDLFGNIIIPIALMGWIIRRQMTPKMISNKMTVYLIIIFTGIATVANDKDFFTLNEIAIVAFTFIVSAVLFGFLRGCSYHIWVADDGLVMRRGTIWTAVLWLISIIIHLAGELSVPQSAAFSTLYIGLSLFSQRKAVFSVANRKFPNEIQTNLEIIAEKKAKKKAKKMEKKDRKEIEKRYKKEKVKE